MLFRLEAKPMKVYPITAIERLNPSQVPDSLRDILARLVEAGHEAFCVGGSVRDLLMGRQVHDWDVTTSAEPKEVVALFPKVIKTGIEHGTVSVIVNKESFEVTTYRVDVGASDGRHPDRVDFSRSLEEDLQRRDFTMNAIAWNPLNGHLVDPHDGRLDIESGLIRAVGNAHERLSEDGLRSLRALRFKAVLGFELEDSLDRALCRTLDVFERVSVERIWQEMSKLLLGSCASESISRLKSAGMWDRFWPSEAGVCLAGLNGLPLKLELRVAHLFRTCPHLFRAAAKAIKIPNRLMNSVVHLLECLGFDYGTGLEQIEVFRLRAKVGLDFVEDVGALAQAGIRGVFAQDVKQFIELIALPPYRGAPVSVSQLAVDGRWILNEFNLKPSPKIGWLLNHCLE
ncbi:MAG: CCA tRNA nucleotidyltransferase, partial [Bradymonadia bacterium]